jgi:hypothetical protein
VDSTGGIEDFAFLEYLAEELVSSFYPPLYLLWRQNYRLKRNMRVGSRGDSPHSIEAFKKAFLGRFDNQEVNIAVSVRLSISVRAKENDLLRGVSGNQPLDDFLNHRASLAVSVHEILTSDLPCPSLESSYHMIVF